jgi:hypothetical protein
MPIEGNKYVAKVIDFGELTRNELVPKGYTANYFLNPVFKYDSENRIIFNNMEQRY